MELRHWKKKATWINANLVENYFRIKNINAKERVTFQNEGNSERDLSKGTTELVETTGTELNV